MRVAQLVLVWLVGTVVPYLTVIFVVAAVFGQAPGALVGFFMVGAVVVLGGLLRVIAGRTASAMRLGESGGGRWLWTLLVLGGGAALLGIAWSVFEPLRPSSALTGVGFALVAGLLLRDRRVRPAAAGVLVALFVGGSVMLRASGPDEADDRLRAANLTRDSVDRPGSSDVPQAYLAGHVLVTGGESVDRQLLRRTALAARPATEQEILDNLRPARHGSTGERYRSWLKSHF